MAENQLTGLTIEETSLLSNRIGDLIPRTISNRPIYTYGSNPTAVELSSFTANRQRRKITLKWETASELDIVSFNFYRSGRLDGTKKKLNTCPISAVNPLSSDGVAYSYLNRVNRQDKTYSFWLEIVDREGNTTLSDPIKVKKWR
jgi:hypothetical protein